MFLLGLNTQKNKIPVYASVLRNTSLHLGIIVNLLLLLVYKTCSMYNNNTGGCVSATPGGKVSFSLQITNPPLWQSLIDASLIRK